MTITDLHWPALALVISNRVAELTGPERISQDGVPPHAVLKAIAGALDMPVEPLLDAACEDAGYYCEVVETDEVVTMSVGRKPRPTD